MKMPFKIVSASLALMMTGISLINAVPGIAVEAEAASSRTSSSDTQAKHKHSAVKKALQTAMEAGLPGILVKSTENGKRWAYSAGIADLTTEQQMQTNYLFRIGSVTKTFTATVILQLAGENRLNLDDSIEKWLPGVVHGNGYEGKEITVRQLLNHTSGISEYLKSDKISLMETRKTYTPEEIVSIGLAMPADFAPGKGWSYSNTGYVLLGMLIEKVTGTSYAEEIERRILEPLELSDTILPGNSTVIPGNNHARGYFQPEFGKEPLDVTYYNPSVASSAGDIISSADDLNTFFSALLGGQLLKEEQLKQMLTPVETGLKDIKGYGLGIYAFNLQSGDTVWGHTGGIPGFATFAGGSVGGKHTLAVSTNYLGAAIEQDTFTKIVAAEFDK
ncbi:serine hydrolase domain-containing protein [Paenibacillus lutrae]|uniref:Serine hydrolase n=1 Tax=Paenibacillus lutrae TaxID=2078573 RepID=A0A7X3JXQ9_9BACL|nr:serine hydrolase domain-containing protein [Paenibacillus lutrae]MVO98266.1 serine hydrolase [Paenibacillus lutrae]